MTEERAGTWTCTSRVIRARPDEVYAAFLDPTALIDWLPPEEMTGEIHEFDARVGADIGCPCSTRPMSALSAASSYSCAA